MTGEHSDPFSPEYDAQFEALREAIRGMFTESGWTFDDLFDDPELFERISEKVQDLIPGPDPLGLEADSLLLIELVAALEEEDDDEGPGGFAGD